MTRAWYWVTTPAGSFSLFLCQPQSQEWAQERYQGCAVALAQGYRK